MRLFELVDTNSLVTKLVAVTDQLKADLDSDKADPSMTVSQFLSYLQKFDINLDKFDLYNMIQKPPLDKLIGNIQGEHIVFKGFGSPESPDSGDDKEKIVKSMAHKAAKSLSK